MRSIKIHLFTYLLVLNFNTYSQDIVNLVYVGDNGITEDIKQAHSFVVVKQYPGGVLERLDYKLGAPLKVLRTYSDSNLSILEGKYLEYDAKGILLISGQYNNNQKDGSWNHYDDTGKVVLQETYDQGSLVGTVNPDTVKKKDTARFGDEREAEFAGGKSAWIRYLQKSLNNMNPAVKELNGKVRVMFTVGSDGKLTEIYLRQSAQFGLDEEALKIIRLSPPWNTAFQNGHPVKAYRVQPLTFVSEEN